MAKGAAPRDVDLHKTIDRQMDMLRAYKQRQDDIVLGLGRIREIAKFGAPAAVALAVEELLARDLKQAAERVGNRDAAMKIAVAALQASTNLKDHPAHPHPNVTINAVADKALSEIRVLFPDAFAPDPVPAGAS